MAIRFAAASGLALAAALLVAAPARAQGFFSFFEMSPRQVVSMLEDDGYELRGPMVRRGDVYVINVVSVSGRPVRLIVDARDGRILQRFASPAPNWRDGDQDGGPHVLRPPRPIARDDDEEGPGGRDQQAMGDVFNPPSRVYGSDSLFSPKPAPDAAPVPDVKPKRHVAKKHKEPAIAKAPDAAPSPDASTTPKPEGSSVAAVAPSAPAPEAAKPIAEPPKPVAALSWRRRRSLRRRPRSKSRRSLRRNRPPKPNRRARS